MGFGEKQKGFPLPAQFSGGCEHGALLHDIRNFRDVYPQRPELLGIDLNPHGSWRAVDHDIRDTGEDVQSLCNLCVGVVIELRFGERSTGEAGIKNRQFIRVIFSVAGRRREVRGELGLSATDRTFNIGSGPCTVAVEIEDQNDLGVAEGVVGDELRKALNLHHLALEGRRHVVGHDRRFSPGELCVDDKNRVVHVRHITHGK